MTDASNVLTAAPGVSRGSVGAGALAGRLGGFILGAILLVAALPKALDPAALVEQIHAEGVGGPGWLRWVLALAVLGLEAGIGVALVLGARTPFVLWSATLLVGLFLALTGRAYWRDLQGLLPADTSCGCFGNLVERTPAQAFWQDLLLLVPSLGLAWLARTAAPARWRGALAAAAAVLAVASGAVAPRLPVDDLVTRIAPGVAVAEVCGGRDEQRVCLTTVAPELAEGEAWVVLADVRSDDFAARVGALNDFARRAGVPPLVVLTSASSAEVRAFFWRAGPAFTIHEAPAALLRPLYRELPRTFRVAGGSVVETSPGLAPALLAAGQVSQPESS